MRGCEDIHGQNEDKTELGRENGDVYFPVGVVDRRCMSQFNDAITGLLEFDLSLCSMNTYYNSDSYWYILIQHCEHTNRSDRRLHCHFRRLRCRSELRSYE